MEAVPSSRGWKDPASVGPPAKDPAGVGKDPAGVVPSPARVVSAVSVPTPVAVFCLKQQGVDQRNVVAESISRGEGLSVCVI